MTYIELTIKKKKILEILIRGLNVQYKKNMLVYYIFRYLRVNQYKPNIFLFMTNNVLFSDLFIISSCLIIYYWYVPY